MWKSFGKIALAVLLVAGCKDASVDKPADKSDDTTAPSSGTGPAARSGKIDLGSGVRRRPSLKEEVGNGEDDLKDEFADRRRARIAQFDKDGDGKISDEERKDARHRRAEDMRKQVDANHDGKVTIDELAQGSFRRLDPEGVDINKDGDISVEEIEAALEQRSKAWSGGRPPFGGREGRRNRGSGAAGDSGSAVTP